MSLKDAVEEAPAASTLIGMACRPTICGNANSLKDRLERGEVYELLF